MRTTPLKIGNGAEVAIRSEPGDRFVCNCIPKSTGDLFAKMIEVGKARGDGCRVVAWASTMMVACIQSGVWGE